MARKLATNRRFNKARCTAWRCGKRIQRAAFADAVYITSLCSKKVAREEWAAGFGRGCEAPRKDCPDPVLSGLIFARETPAGVYRFVAARITQFRYTLLTS